MNSPLLWIGISFALGIIARCYGFTLIAKYPFSLVVGLMVLWFSKGKRFFLPLLMAWFALAGAMRMHIDMIRPADAIEDSISPYRIELEGKVIHQPEIKKRGRRVIASFILQAKTIGEGPRKYRRKKSVAGNVQVFWIQPGFIPNSGDALRLWGQLQRPRSALNPGEFDYAKYLSRKNIFTLMQPIGKRSGYLIAKAPFWDLGSWLGLARQEIAALIERIYPFPQSAILKALVVGIRGDVGPVIQNSFMKTGTVHLLAISGLNITMIAGSFFIVFLILRLSRKFTVLLTMIVVAVYVPLAGAGIPVQRAGIMALVILAAVLFGRAPSLLNALCLSFFILLCSDPKSLWNIGFQLSFLCVLSLITICVLFPRHKLFSLSIGGSFSVLIGTFPVILFYFNTFSPVSVVANLIAIPAFDAALFTTLFAMIFCCVPLLGNLLIAISSFFVTCGLAWISWLAKWELGYWFFVRPNSWQIWLYYIGLGLVLWGARSVTLVKKTICVMGFICWAFAAITMLKVDHPDYFRLTILSGGKEPVLHGHFTNGADWLVNAGRNFPSNQGERLVLPYLRQLGIKKMDGILLTDVYKKHCGGLEAILRDVAVRRVLYPDHGKKLTGLLGPMRFRIKISGALKKGTRLDLGNESVSVLNTEKRGSTLLIKTNSGDILFVSNGSLRFRGIVGRAAPDIIILPFLKEPISDDVLASVAQEKGQLVFAGADPGVLKALESSGVAYFDLSQTGAITVFEDHGRFLLLPFLK